MVFAIDGIHNRRPLHSDGGVPRARLLPALREIRVVGDIGADRARLYIETRLIRKVLSYGNNLYYFQDPSAPGSLLSCIEPALVRPPTRFHPVVHHDGHLLSNEYKLNKKKGVAHPPLLVSLSRLRRVRRRSLPHRKYLRNLLPELQADGGSGIHSASLRVSLTRTGLRLHPGRTKQRSTRGRPLGTVRETCVGRSGS